MDILAFGYMAASITQIFAGIPQILKLVKAKNTDGISFTTWGMWGMTQILCLAYNISIKQPVLIAMSSLWMGYYVTMIIVIAYYRWPQLFLRLPLVPVRRAPVPVQKVTQP